MRKHEKRASKRNEETMAHFSFDNIQHAFQSINAKLCIATNVKYALLKQLTSHQIKLIFPKFNFAASFQTGGIPSFINQSPSSAFLPIFSGDNGLRAASDMFAGSISNAGFLVGSAINSLLSG